MTAETKPAYISSIVYTPKGRRRQRVDGRFFREPLQEARLIENYGIENDRKGGSRRRQLNLMSAGTLARMAEEGFDTTPGQMGEQIVINGLALESLLVGTRLQIGESALIEITLLREPCERFASVQGIPHARAVGRVGVLAKVLRGGMIALGSEVRILQAEAAHV